MKNVQASVYYIADFRKIRKNRVSIPSTYKFVKSAILTIIVTITIIMVIWVCAFLGIFLIHPKRQMP